jgi:uncharacterized membrane protein YidH (DUF202 family)
VSRESDCEGHDGYGYPALRAEVAAPRANVREGAELAGWLRTSLLGIALAVVFGKYSRSYAGTALHPGVLCAIGLVLMSASLTLLAARRHFRDAIERASSTEQDCAFPRAQAVISILVALGFSWAAVILILFAGGRP